MDDQELELVAALSFVRSNLETFVLGVLGSMDQNFQAVIWPAQTAELGDELVALGHALRQQAARQQVLLPPALHESDETSKGGESSHGNHAPSGDS
ncbi:hypothetical protein LWC34_27715 [Kibdelosporangium philippinense]|uniref:Uncharacterized protein n=1 Tax=Kibdelosporangium philippinense TaxID=211113 RepID=A0ABS8ZFI0_9PSEU|nr:hypothetical protein [Kibdelosporangium philippinense]MCE7006589.1 hypothetical protein [Kibdelosporangium philippinense]